MKKNIILFLIFVMFALAMTATAGMADTAATPAVTTESNAERDGDTVMINENGISTVKFDGKEMDWFRFGNEKGAKVVILPGVSLNLTGQDLSAPAFNKNEKPPHRSHPFLHRQIKPEEIREIQSLAELSGRFPPLQV